jgi:hypothetical protein
MVKDEATTKDMRLCRSSPLGAAGIAFALPSNCWLFVPGITFVLGPVGLLILATVHMLGLICSIAAILRHEGLLGIAGLALCLLPLAKILNWV